MVTSPSFRRTLRNTTPDEGRPVQNILGLRFANRVLEPLWNRSHIARVEIIWDETWLSRAGRRTTTRPGRSGT
jgi:hypothetical protein